ncbi:MAG: hypothetical protein O7B99_12845, partial [Planctomycetota bacterium]|nr:hypothetical protein [Planctomycetota bacterium]
LIVFASGYAPLILRDWPVPAEPVDLWLEEGRNVRVRVVGPDGAPVSGTRVWSRRVADVPFGYLKGEEVTTGVFDVANLPDEEVVLQIYFGGSTFEQIHDPRLSEATFRVPAWQELVVVIEGAPSLGPGEQLLLRGTSQDLDPVAYLWHGLKDGETEARFDTVFPGRYEFVLEHRQGAERKNVGQPLVTDVGPDALRVTFRL